ncbi:MAG TPA: DUF2017 family protein [Acidimicrobiales bacterium]|nr:DUF2017 family protein [Acidimicrobiales bacterium]
MTRRRHLFRPSARGGFDVELREDERALLAALPARLIAALERVGASDAPVPESLRRLLPPAYLTDAAAESAYVRLVRSELVAEHRAALDLLVATAGTTHLRASELESWLLAVNDLRLVLGTSLEVTEDVRELDPDDARYGEWVCYHYLSYLAEEAVEALSGLLPPANPLAGDDLPDDPWGDPPGGLRWDGTPAPGG